MNTLVEGGTIVTMSDRGVIQDGAIAIQEDRIIEVGKSSELKRKYRGYAKIEAEGRVVIPGLINTHHHAAMSLLRGYADDVDLKTWLEKWVWPLEKHMDGRDIYVGALLTAIESIKGGTTTVNTMYHYSPEYNEARAFADAGLRGVIGHVCFSWRKEHDIQTLKKLAATWHGKEGGRLRVSVDPHAPYTVDPEYMIQLKTLSKELNQQYGLKDAPIIWHLHLAETSDETEKIKAAFNVPVKGGAVEYLDALGVLSGNVVAAHCVHLTPRDIQILKERQVKVVHNPISNLKLSAGISPLPRLIENKVQVSLGTDSSCSNNSSDMFEVMKITALLHKGVTGNPTVLPAEKVLQMATLDGAKSLNWQNEIGSIEEGKKADLAIVNFKKPHLRPLYNEVSHLVYSTKSSDVETVIINGEVVMEDRTVKTVNVDEVLEKVDKAKSDLLTRTQND